MADVARSRCLAGSRPGQVEVFFTRGLADSYRAELVRAARQGLAFDPATGEPLLWAVPGPAATTWLEHAVAYANMKWPRLAASHLRDIFGVIRPGESGGHRACGGLGQEFRRELLTGLYHRACE